MHLIHVLFRFGFFEHPSLAVSGTCFFEDQLENLEDGSLFISDLSLGGGNVNLTLLIIN